VSRRRLRREEHAAGRRWLGGGSPKESQYLAILAFDLHAHGVDLPAKLDGATAREVVLHE